MPSPEGAPGYGLPDELRELVVAAKPKTTERGGQYWIELADTRSALIAELFKRAGARFIALTVACADDEEASLYYHFDVNGVVYSVGLRTIGRSVPSIVELFPGSDWAEREAFELYGLQFQGRALIRPLLLQGREGPPPMLSIERERASERNRVAGQ